MENAIQNSYNLASQLVGISDHVEIEARIKGPIVRSSTVRHLLHVYNMHEGNTYTELRNKASSGTQSVVYRCINGDNVVCKSKIQNFKCYNQWVSIVLSIERDVGNRDMLMEKHFVETKKTRYSQKLYDDTIQLDITHFLDDDIFQVEVEVLEPTENFKRCVDEIITILQDSPMYISRKKFDTVREIVGDNGYYKSNFAGMNVKGMKVDETDFSIYHGKYQKPVTMTNKRMHGIFDEETYITPKLDGLRRFIVVFNGMVYDIDPEYMHVRLVSTSDYLDPFPTILDTELVSGTYYIFDICALEGRYVGDEILSSRLEYMQRWQHIPTKCKIKEYVKIGDDPIVQINNFYRSITMPVDGIIFSNGYWEYMRNVIKWKQHVTVDLIVNGDGTIDEMDVVVDSAGLVDKTGVYELEILDTSPLCLKVLRYREDKKKPNSSKVVANNIIGFELRDVWTGRGCKFMRKYHNDARRELLKKINGTILDVSIGQHKHISRKNTKIFRIEPDQDVISGLESGKIKIIRCRVSDTEKVYRKVGKVDAITMFFSMNLFTQDDLDGITRMVSKYKPKHIVGIFLDKKSVKYINRYPCYEIKPNINGYHIQLFGTRINQDEHLFGLDQLRFDGYKLVESRPLNNGMMSEYETELSNMFTLFHYQM